MLAQVALVSARTRLGHAGLDQVLQQAWWGIENYFLGLFSGTLGTATTTTLIGQQDRPVWDVLVDAYPKSVGLVAIAVGAATVLGVAVGVVAAASRSRRLRALLLATTFVSISLPSFLVAILLLIYGAEFYARTGIHLWPVFGFGWDEHLIVPAIALGARPFAQIASVAYVATDEVLRADYIRTARAKGLLESTVLLRHALRNALVPILAAVSIGISIGLSTLPVVETLFDWRGLGYTLLLAIRRFDPATAGTLLGALAITLAAVRMVLDAVARRYATRGTASA